VSVVVKINPPKNFTKLSLRQTTHYNAQTMSQFNDKVNISGRSTLSSKIAPSTQQCQKCLEFGHWTYQCKGQRAYNYRPSRTAVMKTKKINAAYNTEKPPDPQAQFKMQMEQYKKKMKRKIKKQKRTEESKYSSDESSSSESESSSSSSESSDSESSSSESSTSNRSSDSGSSSGSESDS